jgi:hypothetical protein
MRSERKILTVAEYAAKHLPDVTPAPITLYDVAVATMRRLFPNSRYVREIDRKMKVAALIAASRQPCRMKACPFPVVDLENGLCRGHAADRLAQFSYLPSALGCKTVPQPRTHAHA